MLKTWFELSRVKVYRNDLRGNENYFELGGGSSYECKIHRIFTLWLVFLHSQCLPITASRDFCDYSVFLVRGSGEEVVFIWEGGLNRGFTVNHIPLNCYSSGPKDFHLFAPTFELVPRLKTSRNSFSLSLVFRKSPENVTAFAHSCLPLRYI